MKDWGSIVGETQFRCWSLWQSQFWRCVMFSVGVFLRNLKAYWYVWMLFCKLVGVILRMQSDGNSNFRLSCSFERFGIEIVVRCKGLGEHCRSILIRWWSPWQSQFWRCVMIPVAGLLRKLKAYEYVNLFLSSRLKWCLRMLSNGKFECRLSCFVRFAIEIVRYKGVGCICWSISISSIVSLAEWIFGDA